MYNLVFPASVEAHKKAEIGSSDYQLNTLVYHDLSEEERKAYKYYEYTNPSGTRKIMQDFKKTVLQRVNEYSSSIAWYINHQDVSLADVRVLILKS